MNKKKHVILMQGLVLGTILTAASFFITTTTTLYVVSAPLDADQALCQSKVTVAESGTPYEATSHGVPLPYITEKPTGQECSSGGGGYTTIPDLSFRRLLVDILSWSMASMILVFIISSMKKKGKKK